MSIPINKTLYKHVKDLANKKFKSKTGIYRSSWIVREYKKRGGKYKGNKSGSKLKRWYKEKWVDLNRPIKNSSGKIVGYKSCGRKSINNKEKYPLCRPTYKISRDTPKTYKELSKKSITKAKREKSKVKGTKNIKFGGTIISLYKSKKGYKICKCKNKICTCKKNKSLKVINCKDNKCKIYQNGGKAQYYGKRSKIMVKVPENVKKWALYAFKLKKLGFKGAKETGWKRAKQLSTKSQIPIQDLRYMRNWYARHIITSYPGFKKWVKEGRSKDKKWHNKHAIIAWITWGGDAGFRWVNSQKVINMLNKHFNKNYKTIKGKK